MEFSINKRVRWIRFTYCYCPLVEKLSRASQQASTTVNTTVIQPSSQARRNVSGGILWQSNCSTRSLATPDPPNLLCPLTASSTNHQLTTCIWLRCVSGGGITLFSRNWRGDYGLTTTTLESQPLCDQVSNCRVLEQEGGQDGETVLYYRRAYTLAYYSTTGHCDRK